jgi:two-component system cell cycle sensor histidine kinase/response regulator CckA
MRAGRRARQLVQQILAFSRRAEPSRQAVDVVPLLKETSELLRVLGRGAVSFELRAAGEIPPVFADPAQAHQVFMNIGTNAVQALRGVGGQVGFLVDTIDVTASDGPASVALAPGRYVRVGIQDNGPGMAPEVVARVFEPFFTTKAPGEGTGLGLSVVHGIVQQHGGAVTVYSQPGRGTLFHVYLPAATSELRAQPALASELPRGRGQEILVVDDDDVVLSTGREILVQLGYRPCAFERADAALAEFEARPADFAVVFTDLTMPGMSGLQLTARVKALHPAQPVLLASGFFTETEEQEAVKLRVTRLLPKPFSVASVAEALAACAAKRG